MCLAVCVIGNLPPYLVISYVCVSIPFSFMYLTIWMIVNLPQYLYITYTCVSHRYDIIINYSTKFMDIIIIIITKCSTANKHTILQ